MKPPNEIRTLRKASGITVEDLAYRVGLSTSQLSRIERGERQPTLHNLQALARVLDVPLSSLVAESPVCAVGYISGGNQATLYSDGQGPLEEVERPPKATDETVAVIVRGDSMSGTADDGWVLYYDDVRHPPTDDLLGKLCIVALQDGRILAKKLHRGRGNGLYDLHSTNMAPMFDQAVDWAAKVTWIQPR